MKCKLNECDNKATCFSGLCNDCHKFVYGKENDEISFLKYLIKYPELCVERCEKRIEQLQKLIKENEKRIK